MARSSPSPAWRGGNKNGLACLTKKTHCFVCFPAGGCNLPGQDDHCCHMLQHSSTQVKAMKFSGVRVDKLQQWLNSACMASSTGGSQKALQSPRRYALHTLKQWATGIPDLCRRSRHHQAGTRGWSLPSIAGLTSKRHLCSEEPHALGSHGLPWYWSTPPLLGPVTEWLGGNPCRGLAV